MQDQCLAPETMPDERGRRIFLAWVQSQQIVKFRTKKDTVNQALTEFIQRRKQLGVLDWKVKVNDTLKKPTPRNLTDCVTDGHCLP